ncbi:hypothetical protein PanWU01x14_289500 [Parasponia andersonii]|uniref:Protein MIZU-KUSSEI n=1 Tax=Parasponia andersonii TaxID=3476 RepID=A0A2P5AY41_PARAD|nr:hypothetical protein PanWU01x14_289500 [Parasponia andersonii]
MAYPTIGGAANISAGISGGVTVVDCHKQVRSWRLLGSLMDLLIPCCNINNDNNNDHDHDHHQQDQITKQHRQTKFLKSHYLYYSQPRLSCSSSSSSSSSSTYNVVTGTIFGYRRGKVNLCIQTSPKSSPSNVPLLLVELAVSTTTLAREMRGGFLRIALESQGSSSSPGQNSNYNTTLLSTPVWTMYCNGRKVGYAVKRLPAKGNLEALRLMESVVAGAGLISGKKLQNRNDVVDEDNELMYFRASFERVCGSENSESFHLIDPDGCIGQELSIFFYRSR